MKFNINQHGVCTNPEVIYFGNNKNFIKILIAKFPNNKWANVVSYRIGDANRVGLPKEKFADFLTREKAILNAFEQIKDFSLDKNCFKDDKEFNTIFKKIKDELHVYLSPKLF